MNYKPLLWAGTATLVMLTFFLLISANHLLNTAATANTVSFTGQGKVSAKPDIATITASIVTEASTAKAAQDENSKKSNAVVNFLKSKGIADKDIKTSSYNVSPKYTYSPTRGQDIDGYTVNQSIEVKVRNLDITNEILDGIVAAGANQVNGPQLTIDDMEKLKNEARENAVKDAKAKAEALESQIGIRLGKIVNFSENIGGYPIPIYYGAKDMAVGMGGGTVPSIPTGENEVTVDVQITYQIK